VFVPAKTPAAIIERLNQEIVRAIIGPTSRKVSGTRPSI